jgi:hypothetical protein
VPAKPVPQEILVETLRAYRKTGNNKEAAARMLNIPTSTFNSRLSSATRANIELTDEPDVVIAADSLEDQVRMLKAQLRTIKAETLSDDFIKRRIIGLNETDVDPPKWLLDPPKRGHVTGVPTVFASDWHWGEVVESSQINGVNEYNLGVAQKRAKQLINVSIDILKNRFADPTYPGIVFALGGDMVSGDIHEELSVTNEVEIMPAVIDLWGTLIWCISTLADEFGNVFVPCVTGNHGRNTHKMRMKGRNYTSFDWLVYQFLQKHFETDSRVRFLIPDGSDAHYQVYSHKYLLTHGDQFRGGDGMIGALGPIIRGDHRKRSRNAQIDTEYDTLLLGHWHQLIQLQRLIVNGSLKGYDEYAYQSNFPYEPPRQALWLTHPEHGITFSAPILVERLAAKKASRWISWVE